MGVNFERPYRWSCPSTYKKSNNLCRECCLCLCCCCMVQHCGVRSVLLQDGGVGSEGVHPLGVACSHARSSGRGETGHILRKREWFMHGVSVARHNSPVVPCMPRHQAMRTVLDARSQIHNSLPSAWPSSSKIAVMKPFPLRARATGTVGTDTALPTRHSRPQTGQHKCRALAKTGLVVGSSM
jgi:hypothetical protein